MLLEDEGYVRGFLSERGNMNNLISINDKIIKSHHTLVGDVNGFI